jgi:hypothetical protein
MAQVSVIPILISSFAFLFSLYAWRERVVKDRRDLFLRVHERLMDAENQNGRRILFKEINSVKDARALFHNDPERYNLANMALAMLDAAALYAERRYLDRNLFMEEWGYTYKNILKHARYFMTERIDRNAPPHPRPVEHFFSFAMEAADRKWVARDTTIDMRQQIKSRQPKKFVTLSSPFGGDEITSHR